MPSEGILSKLLKTAIYDPQLLTQKGLQNLLDLHESVSGTILLKTESSLEDQIQQTKPQLLALEYVGKQNIQPIVIERIRKKMSGMKVLIISLDTDPLLIREFTNIGVEGFLTKTCSIQEVNLAISTIAKGGKFFCDTVLEIITQSDVPNPSDLSDREMQVIRCVGKGLSSDEIANQLNLSIHTVNSHRKNILKKLGLRSPTELVVYALKKGWVSL